VRVLYAWNLIGAPVVGFAILTIAHRYVDGGRWLVAWKRHLFVTLFVQVVLQVLIHFALI
jgi:hypothetical protein